MKKNTNQGKKCAYWLTIGTFINAKCCFLQLFIRSMSCAKHSNKYIMFFLKLNNYLYKRILDFNYDVHLENN